MQMDAYSYECELSSRSPDGASQTACLDSFSTIQLFVCSLHSKELKQARLSNRQGKLSFLLQRKYTKHTQNYHFGEGKMFDVGCPKKREEKRRDSFGLFAALPNGSLESSQLRAPRERFQRAVRLLDFATRNVI